MTETFPLAGYRAGISQIAESVFETMTGVPVRVLPAPPHVPAAAFTAAVYYAGSWKGAFLLECSAEQAAAWTTRLLSLDAPPSPEDLRDGLGEIANVLAGNLKPLLPPGVGLSIPSVVDGASYSLRLCGGNLFEHIDMADPSGPFRVTLVEVRPDGAGPA